MTQPKPEFRQEPALRLAGLHRKYAFAERDQIPAQWKLLAPHLGKIDGQIGNRTFGALSWRPDGFDYLAGVEVRPGADLPPDFQILEVPARRYAVFTYEGHISGLPAVFDYIASVWAPAQNAGQPSPPQTIEVYDERFDPATSQGAIEVWVGLEA